MKSRTSLAAAGSRRGAIAAAPWWARLGRTSRAASSSRTARRAVRLAAALGVVLTAGVVAACGAPDDEPPYRHVLFLTLDTTRADHLACYGNPTVQTPALDALAREGVRFTDCSSAAATTLASHASLMTGTYPHRHGAARNGFVVNGDNSTLAERLAEEGFWCAGFAGSSALIAATGIDQGFHHYDETLDQPVTPGGADQYQRGAASLAASVLAHVDDVLAREGSEDARLFVFAQFFDPHAPYAPPESEVRRYGATLQVGDFDDIESAVRQQQGRVLPAPLGQQGVITAGLPIGLVEGAAATPTHVGRDLARLYAGEVTAMDAAIGTLLAGWASRGLLDDTLVVVTADHGETFWEHGNFWNHGLWVSQTDVHVPLIVRFPEGRGAGRAPMEPVSGVDVAPTVLEALGLASARREGDPGAGRSLLPLVDDQPFAPRPVFSEATQPGRIVESGEPAWRNERKPRSVRLGPWKLVDAPYLGLKQLFHLERDPGERHDLLRRSPLMGDARAALQELEAAMGRWVAAAKPLASSFDEAQARDLRALGYAEAGQK